MSDDDTTDVRLRDRARVTPLPEAPESLRAFAAGLADRPAAPTRGRFRPWVVFIPAAILVFVGLAIVGGSSIVRVPAVIEPSPSASASLAAEPSALASHVAPTGLRHISATSVEFDVPAGWVDATAYTPRTYDTRIVAWLVDGVADCPGGAPTPRPDDTALSAPCLNAAGESSGTLSFVVMENLNPLPDDVPKDATGDFGPTMIGGFRALERTTHGVGPGTDSSGSVWLIAGPDESEYQVMATYANADAATRQPQVGAVITSMQFKPARPTSPPEVAGLVHFDGGLGFTFDYPAGWRTYYPHVQTFGGNTVRVILATRPLGACYVARCDGYGVQPNTMALRFSIGSNRIMSTPDWTKTKLKIGGQPAKVDTREDDTQPGVAIKSWEIKFGTTTLGVSAWIRGPDTGEFERQLAALIDSMVVQPPAGYGP